jgi:hypothetical protein
MFAGNLFMKPATTPILRGFGFRRVLVVNGLVTAALIGSFSVLSPNTPAALTIVLLFAHGLSRSMQFTAISTLAFVDVPQSQMSSANSFFAVMTQMSMGMGVAVAAGGRVAARRVIVLADHRGLSSRLRDGVGRRRPCCR